LFCYILLFTDRLKMRQQFAIKYNLRTKSKKKSIIYIKNKFEFLKTLFLFSEIVFNYKRYYIQLILIIQLIEITENRSAALLAVCYQYIKVTLFSNFNWKEQLQIILEIIYKYIKNYLEQKKIFIFSVIFYILLNNRCAELLTILTETNLTFSIYRINYSFCFIRILQYWY